MNKPFRNDHIYCQRISDTFAGTMQAIGYYLALPFLYLISLLPRPLFYGFSDIVFFFLYHITRYRKKIVLQNLRLSFPQKNEAELKKISIAFYHYLCDVFLETFQTLTMSESFSKEHCNFHPDAKALFDYYYKEKKSIIAVMGHFGNWEWAGNSFPLFCDQQLYVLYHPLQNPFFNRLIAHMRTRFGTKLIARNETFREMIRHRNEITVTAFIADQTPSPDNAYWTIFLNQDTPVFRGTEIIARKLNYPVVYASVHRIKRGYYQIRAETLFEEPAKTKEGEISMKHIRQLEKEIVKQPETWLWSHRRWKHRRNL